MKKKKFNIKSKKNFSKIRITLDYKEDLLQLNKIYQGLKNKKDFKLIDVLKFLKGNAKIININSHLQPKFKKGEINSNLFI